MKHLSVAQESQKNLDLICTVSAMIVESLNMQLEAEVSDLLDRSSVALYGAVKGAKEERKNDRAQ